MPGRSNTRFLNINSFYLNLQWDPLLVMGSQILRNCPFAFSVSALKGSSSSEAS